MAGIERPAGAKILIARGRCGRLRRSPSLGEALADPGALPRAGFRRRPSTRRRAVDLGGTRPHAVLYTDQDEQGAHRGLRDARMKTGRILVNMPCSHGGHRRPLQFQADAFPDPGLRLLGRQLP